MNIRPGSLVSVKWFDASFSGDEIGPVRDIKPTVREGQVTHTAGFWIGDDADCISFAQDKYVEESPQAVRGIYRIPWGMVMEISVAGKARKISIPRSKKYFRPSKRTV